MQKYCLPLYLLYRTTSTVVASPSTSSSSHSLSPISSNCPISISAMTTSSTFPPNRLYYSFAELQNSTVGYCTDVEGNYEYWKRYLKLSKVLESSENGLQLKSNCYFIYGGDVCDRGVGDLRILQDLVSLKKRYPERVHLILGNRDINKMRLLTELQPESYSQPGETYWTGPLKQTDEFNAPGRLKAILTQSMGAPGTFEYRRQELSELAGKAETISDDDVVQSFLDMVAPDGLMTQYLTAGTLAVLLGDCLFFHGGLHDNTIGYVPPHVEDILSESEMTEMKPTSIPPLPLTRWIEELERFKVTEMEDYRYYASLLFSKPPPSLSSLQRTRGRDGKERCYGTEVWAKVGGYRYPAAGGRLLQYGMGWLPDKSVNPTLIYDNYLNDGAPCPPPPTVISYLSQGGVKRVITGHQPHGDAAVVMNKENIQFLTGDTSYAKDAKWTCPPQIGEQERPTYLSVQQSLGRDVLRYVSQNSNRLKVERDLSENIEELPIFSALPGPSGDPNDTRGMAVSEIYFTFDSFSSSGYIHGVLSNGIPYHFPLPSPTAVQRNGTTTDLVGLKTTDDWWIKGRLTDANHDTQALEVEAPPASSFLNFFSSILCGCSHKNRPITPQDHSPQNLQVDEFIYLVCYSRGREVYNSFAKGKDLIMKGFR